MVNKFFKNDPEKTRLNVIKKNKIDPIYIEQLKKSNIEVINFGINKEIPFFKKKGFLFSRILYLKIFCFTFFPLLKILRNQKPDFLVVSLITFVQLL